MLPWSALIFAAGYALREYGTFHYIYDSDDHATKTNLNVYIASLVLLYAAPPLYELCNYFILSRVLYYVPYHSPIHPGRVLTTFVALSAIVEALTANGGVRVANSNPKLPDSYRETGRILLKIALILQIVILGLFVLLAATYQRRCQKAKIFPANLKAVLTTLYVSSTLIGTRTIYRIVEYFLVANFHANSVAEANAASPILRYEWFFWVFEATLMVTNTFLLNARHPMRYLPRDNTIYLAEDGITEIKGPGYEDKRHWLLTVIDPFDLGGMFQGRNMNRRFWDTHPEGRLEPGGPKDNTEMTASTQRPVEGV